MHRAWEVVRPRLKLCALLLALGFGTAVLVATWGEVGPRLARFDAGSLSAALGCVLAGLLASLAAWRCVLAGLGHRLSLPSAGRVFFVGQLGKYVPGSVWPVLAQAEAATRHAVPRSATAMSAVTVMVLNVASGAAIGMLLLAGAFPGSVPLAILAMAGAVVLLHPAVLPRVLEVGLRVLRRPGPVPRLPAPALLAALGWTVMVWLAYGAQIVVLGRVLGLPLPSGGLVATGAFAAAWTVGFLAAIAPAGAGVRDAALVAALLPVLPAGDAAAVAVVSRLLMTAGDVLWGFAALAVRRPAAARPSK